MCCARFLGRPYTRLTQPFFLPMVIHELVDTLNGMSGAELLHQEHMYIGYCGTMLSSGDFTQFSGVVLQWTISHPHEHDTSLPFISVLIIDAALLDTDVIAHLQDQLQGVILIGLGHGSSGSSEKNNHEVSYALLQAGLTALYPQIDDHAIAAMQAVVRSYGYEAQPYWHYDPKHSLRCRGRSCYATLYRFRQALEFLPGSCIPPDVLPDMQLILEELGRNAIEWGNKGDNRLHIVLSLTWTNDYLVLSVSDEGSGFDPQAVPDPRIDPVKHIETRLASGKRLGGYGIHMIREMSDGIWWNASGNSVIVIRLLKQDQKFLINQDCDRQYYLIAFSKSGTVVPSFKH